jgi:hypothetical protein
MKPIDICLTVDTEFSLGTTFRAAGGAPVGVERVHCRVDGHDWGLGHLLTVLDHHGLRATFFVEALHVVHFGDAPMGEVVQRILAAGHDVQLHLHPQWLFFRDPDWRRRLPCKPPDDRCEGRTEAELDDMIGLGLASFARWGAPRPVALRTGGLRVDRAVYRAMARQGLRLASNIGWGWFEPEDPSLRIAAGLAWIEGVLELPVLTYRQLAVGPLRPLRLFTITATSAAETRSLLNQAWRRQVSPCVILTHPFEFVRYFGGTDPVSPSRITLGRLGALCGHLARHPGRFRVVCLRDGLAGWQDLPEQTFPPIRVPAMATMLRVVANAANDSLRWI